MRIPQLVIATRNAGKLVEISQLLSGLPIKILALDAFPGAPEVDEDRDTLEGNAEKKAQAILEFTGLPSLSDDTGLEVHVLGGAPGVHSARYAGPDCHPADNRKKLLRALEGQTDRRARFRTVVALATSDREVRFFEGICTGTILDHERGDGGFGYDALFVPDGWTQTFAEMDSADKNRIGHRGMALSRLVSFLEDRRGGPVV
ncbi:MAG: RdgB/HAM1 family non-canonical purine NTP pyrophosphatase [Rhodothermales bacterium]